MTAADLARPGARPNADGGPGGGDGGGRGAATFAGTWSLVRFILRRDRLRLALWIGGIAFLVLVTVGSVEGLYPTQADLDAAAEPMYDNAAAIALNGPTYGIDTLGGQVVFQIGSFGYVIVALMGMFLVGRHTRADEETGRTELLRAAVVGRNAPVAAALLAAAGAFAALGAIVALVLLSRDLPAAGAVLLGAAMCGFGLFFACVTAVTVQISEHNRSALGTAGAVLGAAYVVRAVGDIGSGTVSWLSPMGWAQATRPFAGERWWALLLLAGAAVALAGLAFALLAVRDLGGGLVPPRPGPPVASPLLDGPLGLAVRLQRGSVVGWAAGLALTGVAYGSVGKDVDDFVGDNEAFAEVIAQVGGNLTDSFFATSMVMLALIAGGFAIASTLRLRSEESSGRAEPVLAGAVSRSRWAASHLTVALAGSALLMALGGLGMGLMYDLVVGDLGQVGRLLRSALSLLALLAALTSAASRTRWAASPVARLVAAVGLLAAVTFLVAVLAYGVTAGDLEQVGRLTGAGLAYVPALWVLVGLTFLLFGVAPRAVGSAWGVLVGCFVVGLLGQLLDLPSWVSDLSPFEHVPQMPVAGFALAPTAALTAIAGGLLALGFGALRRRDAGY